MENIIIGTAGHVDHGKTTLIKALTGIETDTTEEEKERGMSINLGFAYFDLPGGRRVGIVDVPGHEKFIKNMMAGLAGLNLVLLVIDASEGIMPQTREHIDILHLLGIKDYIIVLTKIDVVDQALLELVEEDIKEQFLTTHLDKAPIIKVGSVSGVGLMALKHKIDEISDVIEQKNTLLPPRMHIDRVFSVKGFGTVVTGTLIEGKVKLNDELMSYPSGTTTKIRSIQVHGSQVTEATAGQRTALNLAGIKMSEIKRGDTLSAPNILECSWMLDVKVNVLPHASVAIGLWDRLRLHIGTKEVLCRAVPLGVDEIAAGEEGFLQLRLEEQVVSQYGDRYIVRAYSPMETIGGGVILDANPTKHRRFTEDVLNQLRLKEEGNVGDLLCDFLTKQPKLLTTVDEITAYTGLAKGEVGQLLRELVDAKQLFRLNELYLSAKRFEEIKEKMITHLGKYHKSYALRMGMPKEELRSKFGQALKGKEIDLVLRKLVQDEVVKGEDLISLRDFRVKYNTDQLKEKEMLIKQLQASGASLLSIEQLTNGKTELVELIHALDGDVLIRLDPDAIIDLDTYQQIVKKVRAFIMLNKEMTLAEFRDMIGSSRKYSMIILEHLDKQKITRRVEDARVLF